MCVQYVRRARTRGTAAAGGVRPSRGGGGGAAAAGITGGPPSTNAGGGGAGSYLADAFVGPTAPSYGTAGPVSNVRYFSGSPIVKEVVFTSALITLPCFFIK